MLRFETGMHTAVIKRISVDAQNRFLVTGSDDKTVRVWDLESRNFISGNAASGQSSPDTQNLTITDWKDTVTPKLIIVSATRIPHVGWVERSETQHHRQRGGLLGFAFAQPNPT
jgi:WD40 repeat protein